MEDTRRTRRSKTIQQSLYELRETETESTGLHGFAPGPLQTEPDLKQYEVTK